jgi:FKBP-type peptidyl-prolyl cis-trans isomerase
MSKASLREQRRQARVARQKRQRNIVMMAIAAAVIVIAGLVYVSLNNQRNTASTANATLTAQATTGAVQAATGQALASSVAPMTFPGTVSDTVKTASGLQYKDIKVGDGAAAKSGDSVSVHYTGWLTDGTKFDSSVDRGQPFTFQLGAGGVIKGWDEGVVGMKVGGTRILIIPPELGYGAQANGPIPANSTLIFEVVLLSVQ